MRGKENRLLINIVKNNIRLKGEKVQARENKRQNLEQTLLDVGSLVRRYDGIPNERRRYKQFGAKNRIQRFTEDVYEITERNDSDTKEVLYKVKKHEAKEQTIWESNTWLKRYQMISIIDYEREQEIIEK